MSKQFPVLYGELTNNVAVVAGGRKGVAKHLQPGVVHYENPDGTQITYLLEMDAIEAMRPTAGGIPVVGKAGDFDHLKVEPEKEYDGKIVDSFWDGDSGWEAFHFDGMNEETASACESGYKASCAYVPTEVDETPGKWHDVPYDARILKGRYTHLAVVPVPRYKGADIELQNSLKAESIVNKALRAVLALVPMKELSEVFNSIRADRKKDAVERKNSAKAAYDEAMKNAADDAAKDKAKTDFEKANAEADAMVAEDESPEVRAKREEKKNRVSALRNAADAVEKASGPEKAKSFRDEADALERDDAAPPPEPSAAPKIPIGGGDVRTEPGVTPSAPPPAPAKDPKDNAAGSPGGNGGEPERDLQNAIEAWNSGFSADLLDEKVTNKVVILDGKITPLVGQPAEVQNSWKAAVKAVAGSTASEKVAALKAKATEAAELRNAAKKKAEEEAQRTERFNSLRRIAEERGGFSGVPPLGADTMQDKANLGRELYGV